MVRETSGIILDDSKEYLVRARIGPLARKKGFANLEILLSELTTTPFGDLHREVVEALATNETSFFRDIHPFESLRAVVLPELIRSRSPLRTLNIWCGACSSGQEPYSIAMIIDDAFPELRGWSLRIIASDISEGMLEKCRQGRYTQLEVNRGMPSKLLIKYFEKDGYSWVVTERIRRRVEFVKINLTTNFPPLPAIDIVFLRNVLIYFEDDTKRTILGRIGHAMRPDSYLFMGGAETILSLNTGFKREMIGRTPVYRYRPEGATDGSP